MTTAREWLTERDDPILFTPTSAMSMRNALLAILDELDYNESEYGFEVAGDVVYIINRELGLYDDDSA